jgi:signal transduction histidine kinase
MVIEAREAWLEDATLRTRWRAATAEVIAAMLAGQDPDQFLRVVASVASDLVGGDVATIGVPLIPGQSLRLRIAVGYRAEDLEGAVFPVNESLSGQVLQDRRGMVLADATSNRNAYQPICELGDMGPTLLAPLVARDEAFGTLLVARRRGTPHFDEHDLELLESFADHAALAFEFGSAREQLTRLAVVEERERIGRELHDTVVQNLFAIGLGLQAIAPWLPEGPDARVANAAAQLNDVISEIRSIILDGDPQPQT